MATGEPAAEATAFACVVIRGHRGGPFGAGCAGVVLHDGDEISGEEILLRLRSIGMHRRTGLR